MIDSAVVKQIYIGDGTTTNFPFWFPFSDVDHVKVSIYDIETETETKLERDYYVDANASKVIYPGYPPGEEPPESEQPPILPNTQKIIIYRQTPVNQLEDLGDKYPLPLVEAMVDKATMLLQEMDEKVSRAVTVEKGDVETPEQLKTRLIEGSRNAAASAEAAAISATNAARSERNAANSEANAAESEANAAVSESSASASANAAAATVQEGQTILASTAEYARQAAQDAAGIHESAIPAWNPSIVYSYPTMVAYTDGHNYRCIGQDVPAGTIPSTSPKWVLVTNINGDDYFEIDMFGNLQPRVDPSYSASWELDEDDNIQPRGLETEMTIAATNRAEAAALEAVAAAEAAAASEAVAKDAEDHIVPIVEAATLLELDADDNITTKESESD